MQLRRTNRASRGGSLFLIISVLLSASFVAGKDRHPHVDLFPRLRAEQSLEYQVSYHSARQVKTETPAFAQAQPRTGDSDVNASILLEILGVQPQGQRAVIHARTTVRVREKHIDQRTPGLQERLDPSQGNDSAAKFVNFTILPDGRADKVAGLDQLAVDQQQAWQEWLSRFLLAATLPGRLQLHQKWNSEEPERSPSPISGLRWVRESSYAADQACRPVEVADKGRISASESEPENCAVIVTTATLKQHTKESDTTPDDFRVRELRTTGSSSGKNHIITYISLKTGLLIRANEESTQQMNVTIAKTDGSNRVHYTVDAKSHSEVLLVKTTGASN